MHQHPVTYTNFNGEQKSKTLFFNLSEAELTKLQKDYLNQGGIQVVMNSAIESGDTKELLDFFEVLVRRSYGIKSADGEVFDKNEQIWNDFENSAFYSDLYMSFFQDEGKVGQAFIRAVMPANLIAKAEANVRGEGDLAAAAQQFKPDARTVFEQSRDNLKDHMVKVADHLQNSAGEPVGTTNIFQQATQQEQTIGQEAGWNTPSAQPITPQPEDFREKTTEKYEPQNQPQAPSFGGTPSLPTQSREYRIPVDQDPNAPQEVPMTRAEFAQQQAEQVADQQHVSRPPHESGPGYSAGL